MHRLKVRGWKKTSHTNVNNKKAGAEIFISDKKDFKTKARKEKRTLHNDKMINT